MGLSLGFLFCSTYRISVFVPVPYCLDDCGFVVEPEVRQVDSSSSILFSQDCFGYSMFLYFCTNCEIICSAAATAAKSLQSSPTLYDPIDGSPPGSPVPGILQARTLKWVAISFSNA